MNSRGVSILENLAMERKNEGNYVARGLSFQAAEFSHMPCKLQADQTQSLHVDNYLRQGALPASELVSRLHDCDGNVQYQVVSTCKTVS
jgi:hypothetical protein